jgi:putative ABC transport system permease protein
MTGIVIGVVAALVVVAIGQGVQHQVEGQLAQLSKDLITVRPSSATSVNLLESFGANLPTHPLTSRDVTAAQKVANVASVTPVALVDGTIDAGQTTPFKGAVIGTTEDFARVLHQPLAFGAFFNEQDNDGHMAVVGSNAAADLFDENVPLGRGFSFRGQEFVVVGILKPFETTPLIGQVDFNDAVFIPYPTAQDLTRQTASIYEMLVRPSDSQKVDSVVRGVGSALRRTHGGQQTFSVLKQGQSLQVSNGIVSLMSKLVLAAAATSLLVGGIGVMNIMWVSVTERMREIGIRKAVGATSRQILGQFLTEALVLTLAGWALGVIVSLASIALLRLFSPLQPVIPWLMLGISFVVTLATGVIFGSIPALKAAVKDPIDALRNE